MQPWQHQVEAWNAWHDGFDVLLTTPTGSGKTLAFGIPLLSFLTDHPDQKVLMIFPQKALSRDQATTFTQLIAQANLSYRVGIIDGDVPQSKRDEILTNSRIIITNPHVLHAQLASHANWGSVWGQIGMVIADEVHSYVGLLGSHVAWVMRRLWRIRAHYGGNPYSLRVMAASATLDDPAKHFASLFDRTHLHVVSKSTASTGPRKWITVAATDHVLYQLIQGLAVKNHQQVMVYVNSRSQVERVSMILDTSFPALRVARYRSGLPAIERSRIEDQLRTRHIDVIVTTSALAAGIDVGSLDTVIMYDIPPDLAVFRQVAGRAGRRGQLAHVIVMAGDSPLGVLVSRPGGIETMLKAPLHTAVQLWNPIVMHQQLPLLISELPLENHESIACDLVVQFALAELSAEKVNDKALAQYVDNHWISPAHPKPSPLLLGVDTPYSMVDISSGEILEKVSTSRAVSELYQGARIMRNKRHWQVKGWDGKVVKLTPLPESDPTIQYSTTPQRFSYPYVLETIEDIPSAWDVKIARVQVTMKCSGYVERGAATGRVVRTYNTPLIVSYNSRALVQSTRHNLDHAVSHTILRLAEERLGIPLSEIDEYIVGNQLIYVDRDGERGLVDLIAGEWDALIGLASQRLRDCGCGHAGCLRCSVLPGCNQPMNTTHTRISAMFGLSRKLGSSSISSGGVLASHADGAS